MSEATLDRYIEQATIDRIRREWEAKGFRAVRQRSQDRIRPDLLMKRGEETIAFEVTTAKTLRGRRDAISTMARTFAKLPNTTFRLVVANPPREKRINVEGLGTQLLSYISENLPEELDALASHTFVESVSGAEVSNAEIRPGGIRVAGDGVVTVRLEYGSASDQTNGDGSTSEEAFPFEFDATLDNDLRIVRVDRLKVDTSSFYEDEAG